MRTKLSVIVFITLATALGHAQPPAKVPFQRSPGFADKDEIASSPKQSLAEKVRVAPLAKTDGGFKLTITGHVLNPDGSGAAGATVIVREQSSWVILGSRAHRPLLRDPRNESSFLVCPDVVGRTIADEEGRFRFEELPATSIPANHSTGVFAWDIIATNDRDQVGWMHMRHPSDAKSGQRRAKAKLTLRDTAPVQGTVVDHKGTPISDVMVSVFATEKIYDQVDYVMHNWDADFLDLTYSSLSMMAVTDESGRFSLTGIPKGVVTWLHAKKPGHELRAVPAWAGNKKPDRPKTASHHEPIDIQHGSILWKEPPSISVQGLVVDAKNDPVAGARIETFDSGVIRTDEAGKFTIRRSREYFEDRSRKWPSHGNRRMMQFSVTPPEGSDLIANKSALPFDEVMKTKFIRIALPKGTRVVGRFLDEDDGSPVVNAEAVFTARGDDNQWVFSAFQRVDVDDDGTFSVTIDNHAAGYVTLSHSPTHSFCDEMHIPNNGYGATPNIAVTVPKPSGQGVVDLGDIRCSRRQTIPVRVLNPDGAKVQLADVTAGVQRTTTYGVNLGSTSTSVGYYPIDDTLQTDADGMVHLFPRSMDWDKVQIDAVYDVDGVHRVGTTTLARSSVSDLTETAPVTVTLQEPVIVTGLVTLDGLPVADASLRLKQLLVDSERKTTTGERWLGTSTTDNSGRYTFHALAGEAYSVLLNQSPADGSTVWLTNSVQSQTDGVLEVAPFEFKSAGKDARTLIGLVTDQDGNTLNDVSIRFRRYSGERNSKTSASPQPTKSDSSGRFTLQNVSPKPMQLTVNPQRPGLVSTNVLYEPVAGPLHIKIDTRLSTTISTLSFAKTVPRDEWIAGRDLPAPDGSAAELQEEVPAVPLTANPNHVISGVVVGTDGRPIAGARLDVLAAKYSTGITTVRPEVGTTTFATSDAKGRFRMQVTQNCIGLNVAASSPGYAKTQVNELKIGRNDNVIEMDRGWTLTGRFMFEGVGVPGLTVAVCQRQSQIGELHTPQQTVTGEGGRFVFDRLPSGVTYSICTIPQQDYPVALPPHLLEPSQSGFVGDLGDVAVVASHNVRVQWKTNGAEELPEGANLLIRSYGAYQGAEIQIHPKEETRIQGIPPGTTWLMPKIPGFEIAKTDPWLQVTGRVVQFVPESVTELTITMEPIK